MAILTISRDWGVSPSIVRITTTDDLDTITEAGYLNDEAANIEAYNRGEFTWEDTDFIAISYDGGEGFFTRDADDATFVVMPLPPVAATLQYEAVTLTAAQFNGMYAAPVLLVEAPGANKLHVVDIVVYEVDYGTAQFANGGDVAVQFSDTANGAGALASAATTAATFIAITADSVVGAAGSLAVATAATTVNQGLYLSNLTGAFDTGDSDVTVHIWYNTIDTEV